MAKLNVNDVSDKAGLLGFKMYYERAGYRIENGKLDVLVTNLDKAVIFLDHFEKIQSLTPNSPTQAELNPINAIEYALSLGNEGSAFLELWHVGNFEAIDKEFPSYKNPDSSVTKLKSPSP